MTLISLPGPVLGNKIILPVHLLRTKMLVYHPNGCTLKMGSSSTPGALPVLLRLIPTFVLGTSSSPTSSQKAEGKTKVIHCSSGLLSIASDVCIPRWTLTGSSTYRTYVTRQLHCELIQSSQLNCKFLTGRDTASETQNLLPACT